MEKRYLTMQMRSCEDNLKGKTTHFRLPSASQKRACLSSLIHVADEKRAKTAASESQLVLVLLVIGGKSGASFRLAW